MAKVNSKGEPYYKIKYPRGKDGNFHCPVCDFKDASVQKVMWHRRLGHGYVPADPDKPATQTHNRKEKTSNGESTQSDQEQVNAVSYFLAGRFTEQLSSAASATGIPERELAQRVGVVLQSTKGWKMGRA